MEVKGTYTFEAPREEVWAAFMNPDVLAKTLPGCEKLEQIGENSYRGAIKVKVGPVQGEFQGTVELSDLNEPESYKMAVDGKGPAGFLRGVGFVRLEDQGESTLLHYEGEAQVGGRIASVGQRLIDSTSKSLTRQSLENLHRQIKAMQATEPQAAMATNGSQEVRVATAAPAPQPVLDAPSQTQFALDVAKDVLDDLIPPERRTMILAVAGGLLLLFLLSRWWGDRVAERVAAVVSKR